LTFSFDFFSDDLNQLLVPAEFVLEPARLVAIEVAFVAVVTELVFELFFFPLSLGIRVVTLAMGTQSTFVRDLVSISAVQDIPGRKPSFSLTRIFTLNLVAS